MEEELFSPYISPDFSFLFTNKYEERFSDFGFLNDAIQFNVASPTLETCLEEISKLGSSSPTLETCLEEISKLGSSSITNLVDQVNEDKSSELFPFSFDLLNNHSNKMRRLNLKPRNDTMRSDGAIQGKRLSNDEALRIAGARFIQSRAVEDVTCVVSNNPFEHYFSGFSPEETRDIELVELLLCCAEKVGDGQFERARKLLDHCEASCSKIGNSIERVVCYFCEALRLKIQREMGKNKMVTNKEEDKVFYPDEAMMRLNATMYAVYETVPFSQLSTFAGIQAIFERVQGSKRVHIIDLGIRNGSQWTILMKALESCDQVLELLKITALATKERDISILEETGQRLSNFAQTLELPFCFRLVRVSNIAQLKEELFEVDSEETLAIYMSFVLRAMLSEPDQLECLMRVVTNLNPIVMVMTEVEASHNSPVFVSRFVEALFFFGAYFDCLETFMKGDQHESNRRICESDYFGHGIKNIVSTEGSERKIRHVTVDVWRAFFRRFGLEDVPLSSSSFYQVKLILKKFSCEDFCTVDMNENCLIFQWKGTPIQSLSVWKFLEC